MTAPSGSLSSNSNRRSTSMRERLLPVVAQPFPDEAFGSWFGRLAKRYRLGVDELAGQLDVQIDFGARCSRWLATKPPIGASLARLSSACRLSCNELQSLDPGASVRADFGFCESCFFLNPFDVTELYWKRDWLSQDAALCDTHARGFDHLSPSTISTRLNMREIERFVSRRRRQREAAWQRLSPYQQWCREQKGASSSFVGHQ